MSEETVPLAAEADRVSGSLPIVREMNSLSVLYCTIHAPTPERDEGAQDLAVQSALRQGADELAKQSVSENTRRSYKSDWESWEAFCCFHGFTPLPADPEQVRLCLTQLCQYAGRNGGPVRPRTAQRHLGAIAAAHR